MSQPRLRAAIVGLGQVGLQFDRDRKRRGVWTHFTAYERLSRWFDLVAVCEPDPERREQALARRPVVAYSDLRDMLRAEPLDVVSLCTPPALHAGQIALCAGRVRAVICEKPLAVETAPARRAVAMADRKGMTLVVNYYKRFEANVETLRQQILVPKRLGELRRVTAKYTGPFEAVGSHMTDLLGFLLGRLKVRAAWKHARQEDALSAVLDADGVPASLEWTGPRAELLFEIEVFGSKGRAVLSENCGRLSLSLYKPSPRYSGYSELVPVNLRGARPKERFLPLFEEVFKRLTKESTRLTSSGTSALVTQTLMNQIRKAANHG